MLVTPRNSVRAAWNRAALRKHCARTGNILYQVTAEDTADKSNPRCCTMREKLLIARKKVTDTGRLAQRVELAVGMQVMVTLNLATEADLANGSCGTVECIVLDSREPPLQVHDTEEGVV